MKNKNNIDSIISTNEFKITFLIAIFAMILITATLYMGIKAAVIVFAQGNNSTNGTSSLQSNNQTFAPIIGFDPEQQYEIRCVDYSVCGNSHANHGK